MSCVIKKVIVSEVRAPFFHSLDDESVFLTNVGYRGAIAAGRAAVNEEGVLETKGSVAKETFLVSRPGAGGWTLPGVGVEGAVTAVGVVSDLGLDRFG